MFHDQLYRKTDHEIHEWVRSLVIDKVPEDFFIDYKVGISFEKPDDKVEFAKDVTAFSNTRGGVLVIGVDEERGEDGRKTGIPVACAGVQKILDFETQARNILDTAVVPRPQNVLIREIKISQDEVPEKYFYLIYHPKSLSGPHMVRGSKEHRYYKRSGPRNIPMEHWEIEEMFKEKLRSQKSIEQYLATVDDGSIIIKKDLQHPTIKFILVPLPLNENMIDIFGSSGREFWSGRTFMFQRGGHDGWRPCANGVVHHQEVLLSKDSPYLLKIHPTGAINYIVQVLDDTFDGKSFYIPFLFNMGFPKELRDFLVGHIERLNHQGDFLVQVSMSPVRSSLNAGLDPEVRTFGQLTARPEYFQSNSLQARVFTTGLDLVENLEKVVDGLLDDVGLKIGVWAYATELKKIRSGQDWYRVFLNR